MSIDVLNASGIYAITHAESGKMYVGSAVNIGRRLTQHKRRLHTGSHVNAKLQNAWNKHGENAFTFKAILVCGKDELIRYEQSLIDAYESVKNGYNICPTAGSILGVKRSAETKAKMSASLQGNTCAKGHVKSTEHRAALSAALMGKRKSPEHCAANSAARIGKSLSPETCAKLSEVRKGNTNALGKKHSAETIAKRRATLLETNKTRPRKQVSAETRAKMSASAKGNKNWMGHEAR